VRLREVVEAATEGGTAPAVRLTKGSNRVQMIFDLLVYI